MKKLFDEIDAKGEKDQPGLVSTFHVSYRNSWEPAFGIEEVRFRREPTSADHQLRKPNIYSRKLMVSKLVAS